MLVLPVCRLSSAQVPRAGCGRMLLAKKDSWLESGTVENHNYSKVVSNHGTVTNQYYKVTVPGGKNTRHSTTNPVECLSYFQSYSSSTSRLRAIFSSLHPRGIPCICALRFQLILVAIMHGTPLRLKLKFPNPVLFSASTQPFHRQRHNGSFLR